MKDGKKADKKKSDNKMAGYLGTGGASNAASAMINRHQQLEDAINGSYKKTKGE
jgi:hypothetical protein